MSKKSRSTKKKSTRTKKSNSKKASHSTRKGRLLEEIAARMHGAPEVKVRKNVKLPGLNRNAKFPGEIDVLLSSTVLGYPVDFAVECKNLKGKVGKEKIESFVGKLEDVGIPHQHGIYISSKGYTKDALDRARTTGIRLLTLTGLTPDGLASEQTEANQFGVFYLAQVGAISLTNEVAGAIKGEELLVFFDNEGKFCGTIVDLIWNKWQEGVPPTKAGEYKLDLTVPQGWHQIVNGKREPILAIDAKILVWALVVTIPGKSEHHTLINASDMTFERSQLNVSFDIPRKGKTVYTLASFTTETELQSFLDKAEGVSLTIRRRLPRIQQVDRCFYPLSKRVAQKIKEHTKDFVAGKTQTPPPPLKVVDLEGTDLNAMWEPLCEGYPGKMMPVLITNDDDEVIDVSALMRAKEFGRVVELRPYYERQPRPELLEILCQAYELQGLKILSNAKSKTGTEAERLTNLALEKAHLAIHLGPYMPDSHHGLGVMLQALSRYEEAIASFDRALALDAGRQETWVRRAESQAKLRKYEDSLTSYDRALSIEPEDMEVIFHRSAILMGLKRYEESISGYDELIKADDNDFDSWYYRGVALNKSSRFAEAVRSFDRAIDLESEDNDAWAQRGFALHNLGRIEEAAANYGKAIEIDANMHQVALLLGFALAQLDRNEEAIISFDRGLLHQSGDHETWSARAAALGRLGRDEEALESYDRALKFESDIQQTLLNRGLVLHRLDRLEEAYASFDQAIKLDPQNPAAWHARGFVLYLLERDEEALSDYDHALSITKNAPGTWSNRALPLAELGKLDDALQSVEEALRLTPDPADRLSPLLVRAKIYHRLDRKQDAVNDIIAAWKLDPEQVSSSEDYRSIFTDAFAAITSPSPEISLLYTNFCQKDSASGAIAD